MTLPIDPKDFLGDVYDHELGFRPTNMSVKPVHVANGLGRDLLGATYDSTALAETLRRWVRNQKLGVDEERHSNESIVEKYASAFVTDGKQPSASKLNSLRVLMKDALGADGAVYDSADMSSFTLSNEKFVTRDPSDNRMGSFLSKLLATSEAGTSEAADLIRELLMDETDAWTTLGLPLLELATKRDNPTESESLKRGASADALFAVDHGHFVSPSLSKLRVAMNRLARYEATNASKLNSLRRLVLFGCFALHVHAIGRWSEKNPECPRPPIFLDMFDGANLSIRDASRASLRSAGDSIEGLVLETLREQIQELGYTDSVLSASDSWKSGLPEPLLRSYSSYLPAGLAPTNALAQAYFDIGIGREHPIGAFVELGRRAGYLTPWSNNGRGGKLTKRYSATAEFLETLVSATVEPGSPLEFPDFLDELRTTFGIVIGTQADEVLIRSNNLNATQFGTSTPINEEDLRANTDLLRESLQEAGLAQTYADGRTVVSATS